MRKPAKRGRVRRVLSSSSIGQSSPATREQVPISSTNKSRPIEIKESPEASSAGAPRRGNNKDSPLFVTQDTSSSSADTPVERVCEDSPLFEPQDAVQEVPSQDLAFVQLSEPPSSYRNYTTLGSSQVDPTTDLPEPSQNLPDSQHTPKAVPADTPEEPLVLATSQAAPQTAHTSGQNSTGRVVPDSQSLPTSFDLASQLQADTGDGAASQFIQDLQVAAQAPRVSSQSLNATNIRSPPVDLEADRCTNQAGTPPQSPQRPSVKSPSPGAPGSPSLAPEENPIAALRVPVTNSPDRVAAYDFSSQLDCRDSIEDRVTEPVASSTQHDRQSPVEHSQSPITGTSFPFETQIAPAQTQSQVASRTSTAIPILSHSQPISGHHQAYDSIAPRANSLPNHDSSLSSSLPAIPSQALPIIGESAPPLPYLPSTPSRTPVKDSQTMDRRTPT